VAQASVRCPFSHDDSDLTKVCAGEFSGCATLGCGADLPTDRLDEAFGRMAVAAGEIEISRDRAKLVGFVVSTLFLVFLALNSA
jgi:hypothetical protein